MRRLLLCMLALAVGAGVPAADAVAKSGGGDKHRTKATHHKKKKHKKKRRAASTEARGPKGDKGDRGDPGSSIVNRTRLGSPTSTGDGQEEPTTVPLTGSSWVAAPDEADDWAGMVTLTVPTACDEQEDPGAVLPLPFGGESEPGGAGVDVKLDDTYVGFAEQYWEPDQAGKSVTIPIRFSTVRTLNGDAPTTHTFKAAASDWCGGSGQSFTVTDLRINVYASR